MNNGIDLLASSISLVRDMYHVMVIICAKLIQNPLKHVKVIGHTVYKSRKLTKVSEREILTEMTNRQAVRF